MDLGGVRAQPQMLWGEDLGPETPVDHPDHSQPERPDSNQDVVEVSSDSDEEEWKYVKGNTETDKTDKEKTVPSQNDKSPSQLNPDATEFVPGFPSLEKDEFIAGSPNVDKSMLKNLDDIVVPSESEFDQDISSRACELEPATELDMNAVSNTPSSRREIDFDRPINEDKTDSAPLLTHAANESHPGDGVKINSNPFATDEVEENKENSSVDFVQNYFGNSDLDFKPFESVTSQVTTNKAFGEDLTASHIPNSVSAEISSHFNFIDSHLDSSETVRSEESEKEKNQLEIKEPESPINSEHILSNGVANNDNHEALTDKILQENIQEVSSSAKDSELLCGKTEDSASLDFDSEEHFDNKIVVEVLPESIMSESILEESKEDVFCIEDSKEDVFCIESSGDVEIVDVEDVQPTSDQTEHHHVEIIHDQQVDLLSGDQSNVNEESTVSSFAAELLNNFSKSEPEGVDKECIVDVVEEVSGVKSPPEAEPIKVDVNELVNSSVPDVCNVMTFNHDTNFEVDNVLMSNIVREVPPAEVIHEENTMYSFSTDHEAPFDSYEPEFNSIIEKDISKCNEEPSHKSEQSELTSVHVENISESALVEDTEHNEIPYDVPKTDFTTEKSTEEIPVGVKDEIVTQNIEPMELADTIGPNSFNFSQPYEVVPVTGVTVMDCWSKFGVSDIMVTSMHESLEPDSSFEFISASTVKESAAAESSENIQCPDIVSSSIANMPSDIPAFLPQENGTDHIESIHESINEVSSLVFEEVKSNSVETESAIVESHEVPVSSEPDLVFVEQICPTVEVRSDESSPVNKENIGFDLTSTAIAAAGVTTVAAGTVAAVSALTEEKETVPLKTEESKATADTKTITKPATKAPAAKKPAAGTKPPISKTSAAKSAPAKPTSPLSAKPKTIPASKPAAAAPAATATKKPVAATTKTVASTVTRTAPLSKPAAKTTSTVNKTAAKPPTTTAPKPITKPAPRPTSAASKPAAPLAKPSIPSKTTSSLTRAPLAAKKPTSTTTGTTARAPLSSRPASATETKTISKTTLTKTTAAPKPAAPKTTNTVTAKVPSKLGISAAPAAKLKATSPTKPAPIKAKSPLTAAAKKPATAPIKKASTVLDKNAKNAVKSVPKETAQKEISSRENQKDQDHLSSTTNGHHIENGNVTPHEEIPSHII